MVHIAALRVVAGEFDMTRRWLMLGESTSQSEESQYIPKQFDSCQTDLLVDDSSML